jgi:deoxyribodipyrimidine photo-lyase
MHLVWFRRDLRCADNSALASACKHAQLSGQGVIAAYIATPEQWRHHHMAPIQADLIHRRLLFLQQQLAELNIPLLYAKVPTYKEAVLQIMACAQNHAVTDIYFNNQYEVNEIERDDGLKQQAQGIRLHAFNDALLISPGRVVTGKGQPYKVFTPFRKAWLSALRDCNTEPVPLPRPVENPVQLLPQEIPVFSYPSADSLFWPADDQTIHQRLETFCQQSAGVYKAQRDYPALSATSSLSPYLANGFISPRQCLKQLLAYHPYTCEEQQSGAFTWLNELVWREFYTHLIAAYPKLVKGHAFHSWTELIPWSQNRDHFTAWKHGKTGYPIVDAAMQQLNTLGWMHNRLRMIVASFLTKDLLINWRWGENYFMSKLIDGDFAANNGGWQWAASTGTDAQPYFRIFNPTTQGERFDPKGEFIRQWLPALKTVPDTLIHQPHRWAEREGVTLDYPEPIIDHSEARQHTLHIFKSCKDFFNSEISHDYTHSNVY